MQPDLYGPHSMHAFHGLNMDMQGQSAEVRHSLVLVQHNHRRPDLRVMMFEARANDQSDRCDPRHLLRPLLMAKHHLR
jgi:hypothetical protein